MAPKASLSAKTAQFERFFKVPVHNGLKSWGDLDSYIMGQSGYQSPPPKISGLIASIKVKFYMHLTFGLYLLKKNSILLPETCFLTSFVIMTGVFLNQKLFVFFDKPEQSLF